MTARIGLLAMVVVIAMLAACSDAPSDEEFMEMVKSGTAEEVAAAVETGADLTYATDRDEVTPLMIAARYNSAEVVQVLLDGGADPMVTDRGDAAPLRFAATYNTVDVVRALIDAGSDVEARNPLGQTLLMSAAIGGTVEVVEALLDAGADPQATVPHSFTHLQKTALFLGEANENMATADRLRLLSLPLSEPLADLLARRDEIAAERDANPLVSSQRMNQDPVTGLTEGTFVVRDTGSVHVTYGDEITDQESQLLARGIEPGDLGIQNYILADLVDDSGVFPGIQLFPISDEIVEAIDAGDTVEAYGYFHWGTHDDFSPHLVRRSGNDALMYVLEIEVR